jgi:hypothetical protein
VLEKSKKKKKQKHKAETKMLRFVCQTRRKNSFFLFSKFLFRQTLFYILKRLHPVTWNRIPNLAQSPKTRISKRKIKDQMIVFS